MSENAYYRCYAKVSLSAIAENLNTLKTPLPDGTKAMAVVKANAYGHGSVPVAKYIEDQVDYFAVATLEEAVELRKGEISKPILILSYIHPSCYATLHEYDLTATLFCYEDAEKLSDLSLQMNRKAKVHLAVDTGMGRIGFYPDDFSADVVLSITKLEGLFVEGVFSHLACADSCDKSSAEAQCRLFDEFISKLKDRGFSPSICHIANSAASMEMKCYHNLCRFGIALYGLYPSEEVDHSVPLKPAMEVFSHVIFVKTVEEGTPIGYGQTYRAPTKRRIATVSIGYADGFNRSLSGKGYVLIHGKKAPIVGRVCMDQIMVDVTEIDSVLVGDLVTIVGKSGEEMISAEDFGSMCHSFNYEVVSTFMPRVQRVYDSEK